MAHPLDLFQYCPKCGSSRFEIHNFKSKHCPDCGFTYYANPSSATAAFIINEREELLVVRRAKEPAKGTLDLPGGFVDMDESIEEGMVREIEEETGLQVSISQLQYLFSMPNRYLYSGMVIHTLDADYLVRVPNDVSVRAADDAADCFWIPLREVRPEDFGLTSISKAVSRFLQQNC